jgi:G3E family GTPase
MLGLVPSIHDFGVTEAKAWILGAKPRMTVLCGGDMTNLDPLPITLLTGFLGSGKTTLLQRAVRDPAFSDSAVLVNEIGEIGLDHHLVEAIDGPLLELPGGCLCCAVREDLAASLRDLLERRAAGTVRPFRRLVIETSGLADPAPILYTLGADPMLDAELRLAQIVTTIDAVTGVQTLARFAEAARQAAVADLLLITKTDLAPPSAALLGALGALNARAERALAPGDPAQLLFGAIAPRAPADPPPHAEAAHTHDIATYTIALDRPVSRLDFAKALGALAGSHGEDLLRVKGLVGFADRPDRPAVIQGAQHAIYDPVWLEAWPTGARRSWLVFIVHAIPLDAILERFGFAGATPWAAPAHHAQPASA